MPVVKGLSQPIDGEQNQRRVKEFIFCRRVSKQAGSRKQQSKNEHDPCLDEKVLVVQIERKFLVLPFGRQANFFLAPTEQMEQVRDDFKQSEQKDDVNKSSHGVKFKWFKNSCNEFYFVIKYSESDFYLGEQPKTENKTHWG